MFTIAAPDARNCCHESILCHEACVEDCLLVIEEKLAYAAEVFTHETYDLTHICLLDEHVTVCIPHIIYSRLTVCKHECIRIVLARCEAQGSCCNKHYVYDISFHFCNSLEVVNILCAYIHRFSRLKKMWIEDYILGWERESEDALVHVCRTCRVIIIIPYLILEIGLPLRL